MLLPARMLRDWITLPSQFINNKPPNNTCHMMVLIKLIGSQDRRKRHGCGKLTCMGGENGKEMRGIRGESNQNELFTCMKRLMNTFNLKKTIHVEPQPIRPCKLGSQGQ